MNHGVRMMAAAKWMLLNEAEPSAGRGAFAMDLYEVLRVSFNLMYEPEQLTW